MSKPPTRGKKSASGGKKGSSNSFNFFTAEFSLFMVIAVCFARALRTFLLRIERLGKFDQILEPGIHFLVPLVDRVAYCHSLKEEAIHIPNQQATSRLASVFGFWPIPGVCLD